VAQNRGKQFENQVRKDLEQVPNTLVIRLPDQTNGFKGGKNICDIIVYHKPTLYCIECKTHYGNTLPFSNITQWDKLLQVSRTRGVVSGVLVWYIEHDITLFVTIQELERLKNEGFKSLNIKHHDKFKHTMIPSKKKRVMFSYDFSKFIVDKHVN